MNTKNTTEPCKCCEIPCEILMSVKQASNDTLQGSVATHRRYGGVVNNQIKKGFLLSL